MENWINSINKEKIKLTQYIFRWAKMDVNIFNEKKKPKFSNPLQN